MASAKYSGFGISNDLHLEVNDIVGVIKKTDPCGNPLNWFIDNGSKTQSPLNNLLGDFFIKFLYSDVKGIVSSTILKNYVDKNESLLKIESPKEENLSRKDSIGSFDENEVHNYVNTHENVTFAKKSEVNNHKYD